MTAAATEATAATGNTAASPAPEKVYTSDKLTAIDADIKSRKSALRAIEDMDSAEYETALGELVKANAERKAEIANIKAEERKAEQAEVRNKRVAMFDNAVSAIIANNAVQADKKSTQEQKDEAAKLAAETRELVVNALLGSTPKPAATEAGDKKSGSSSANREAIVALWMAGKTHAEIELEGYAKSTVWHAINDYKIAQKG